ncbi:hypothetical protein PsorP6_015398 [Peronosclerospora sorghi]|uniref:Uncharacterized protein n=1 Tax=Peronosclerospora sorghi TaxID=230839 RepID=A0ACC0WQV3_9STRA|nr:hypothetical protein PsorP6_015398 [Peronosclerospora sorghi]
MVWAIYCITALFLSAASSGLVCVKLCKDSTGRPSSVRSLFAIFFTYQCITSSSRLVYFIWLTITIERRRLASDYTDLQNESVVRTELYRMGTSAVLKHIQRHNGWITAVIVIGDTAVFGLTLWIAALVYELSRLVQLSMDRGEAHERAKIRVYQWIGHSSVATFLLLEIVLASVYAGYSTAAYALLVAVYVVQILVFLYMVIMVIVLKVNGRKYESVHGHFVTSPLYRRLKWIMYALSSISCVVARVGSFVYMLFVCQFQCSAVILYAMPRDAPRTSTYAGISFSLFYLRGFVLSLVAGCSQSCVVRACHGCLPDDIKAQYTPRRDGVVAVPDAADTWPALTHPVFVTTDIDSSSALWALAHGRVMAQATHVHDDLLRTLLARYRGYELATAGDSFHLAFPTIPDAVAYCFEAQLELVRAKWPPALHGVLPATRHERAGLTTIFRGLRVRMAVHDAVASEGPLVRDRHAVTGRVTYAGASALIAKELGDVGAGGQILVTKRVAEWLATHASHVAIKFEMTGVGEVAIPRLNTKLEVFQVVPKVLATRMKRFRVPRHIVGERERDEETPPESSSTWYTFMQVSTRKGRDTGATSWFFVDGG